MTPLEALQNQRAADVLAHLCGERCHGFGEVIELCESRGDCVIVVTCPCCSQSFILDDDEYEQLVAWTAGDGAALACGIQALYA